MANKTFSDFTNQTTPLGSDYVVGYRGTAEQRYTLSVISGLIGGSELASPLTTVGDIWGYDGADARIPVGANGEVLVADSTEALGVKWGPTGTSSSLWTQAGSDINYTAGSVSIGTTSDGASSQLTLSGTQYQQTIYGPNADFKGIRFISDDADPVFGGSREANIGMFDESTKRAGDIGKFQVAPGQSNDLFLGGQGTAPSLLLRTADRTTAPFTLRAYVGDPLYSTSFDHELRVSGKFYITGGDGNWLQITGAGGGGGDSSPLTTKGDLYGFTTENARVGTGVDGQVLTVDSTESAGVAWADSAAGCPVTSWREAFEEDGNGDLTPVSSNCINDTMWMLNSDNSLSLRANHFRYVNGSNPYTEEVSF